MLSYSEFLRIFQSIGLSEDEIRQFYRSVKKSIILRHLGKQAWTEIFRMEEEFQWPVLQRIDNPNLPIYQGADRTLLDAFIQNIRKEKKIRMQKGGKGKETGWIAFQTILGERIELLKDVFGLSQKDREFCTRISERYRKAIEKRIREKKKAAWMVAAGAGAATVASAATLWYLSKKEKK